MLSKSDFLKCLDAFVSPSDEMLDGATFVNMNPPRDVSTFGELQ